MSSLHYSNYGIAQPQAPKNPYTNIPWTYCQKLVIAQQIIVNLMRHQRLPPEDFMAFCRANYDPALFYAEHTLPLVRRAAKHYFTGDPEMAYNYADMVNNVYEHYLAYIEHRVGVRAYVRNQRLPARLQTMWTQFMVTLFIYENMNILDGYETYEEFLTDLTNLHHRSAEWWLTSPRQLVRRPPASSSEPSLSRTRSPTDELREGGASPISVVEENETNEQP